MSSTTILTSTPTRLKRTYSIMLSPSKDTQRVQAEARVLKTTTPTPQQIFSWILTPAAVAPCHVRDVLSLQERLEGKGELVQTNKHVGPDFYWLGRVPCRNVRVVGLVVEVTQYEHRTLYTIDDGTGVLECVQKIQPVTVIPEPGKPPPFAPEYPPPAANVGDHVCVVGRAQRRGEFWQILIDAIERSRSANDELKHHLFVRGLHATHYDLKEPFAVPIPEKVGQAGPSTPTQKPPSSRPPANVGPSTPTRKLALPKQPSQRSPSVAPSSPQTVLASSPVKNEHIPATSADSTPKPAGFRKWKTRPSIDPINLGGYPSSPPKEEKTLRGYTISYLRRVPELALLAHRVAKQEIRAARKQAKDKEKSERSKSRPSSSSKPPSSSSTSVRQSSIPTNKDVKRLFIRALNELYREGSIVIWDCPSYSCSDLSLGDSSFLWKTSSTLPPPSINTTTGTLRPTYDEEPSGNLSDPDPNEDVYVPLTPEFLADRLEEVIPVIQKAERARQPKNMQPYAGASVEGLLRYLKKDDRWTHLHRDSVAAALKYLDDEGRAWMAGQDQWQLTV
ncbi:hypothetical protein NMY22_g16330 [Coprinellus aureogranulatus]|nr:hypothetical protein NMY22_g16330 [Coprinellus aureogranulatus]